MLNLNQQQAVKTTEGPLRIIAGAGTGKTQTLISRIAFLVKEKGVHPQKILALTFTNKAAHEINVRLLEKNLPTVNAMTFHSLAARLIRKFWNPDFSIITRKKQEEILKEILTDDEVPDMKNIISSLDAIRYNDPAHGGELESENFSMPEIRLREILKKYQAQLNTNNEIDFTGLLATLIQMWKEKPETLLKCQNLFQYILVDEYQDVNAAQIKIMMDLAESHQNICVVGDPDQTIYSWRGAKAETMTKFEILYPDAVSVSLIKNYRNPPAILNGAEKLIAHNIGRLKTKLQPTITKDRIISYWESESEWRQTEIIFHLLEKYFGSRGEMHMADQLDINRDDDFRQFGDVALLYRTKSQGRFLFEQLTKRGYPCQMSSSDSFWEKKEIVDFLDGVENLSKWTDIGLVKDKFSKWISDKIDKFIKSQNFSKSHINNLDRLIPYAVVFDNLPIQDALSRLLDEARTEQEVDNLIQTDKINLLTLHAAKGLEFPVVMIIGLEEGNLPHKKLKGDQYWLGEERRLLYVGMTRATDELHIFTNKKREDRIQEPSRFLKEIGYENMVPGKMPEVKIQKINRREIKKAQLKLF